jgi:hypothetical protein
MPQPAQGGQHTPRRLEKQSRTGIFFKRINLTRKRINDRSDPHIENVGQAF